MAQSWTVRVVVAKTDIRKVTFHERPNTLEELISELKKRLDRQYDFMLHYEDPEFNYAFCNLTDITELPDRPTLKMSLWKMHCLQPVHHLQPAHCLQH